MTDVKTQANSVLEVLQAGGSVRYYFLTGGVALLNKDGSAPTQSCSIRIFLELREKELIKKTGDRQKDSSNHEMFDKYEIAHVAASLGF